MEQTVSLETQEQQALVQIQETLERQETRELAQRLEVLA